MTQRLSDVTTAQWHRFAIELLVLGAGTFASWKLALAVTGNSSSQMVIGLTGVVAAGVLGRWISGRVVRRRPT